LARWHCSSSCSVIVLSVGEALEPALVMGSPVVVVNNRSQQ
jgi:hypothetical protein